MKKRYYTPTIEEFHVGFECEYQEPNEEEFETNELEARDVAYLLAHPDRARVKYLDKEDIESLGFKYYKTQPGMEQMEFQKENYELTYDPNFKGKKYLRICLEEEGDVTFFAGIVKNKSELKVVLKQLGIEI